ncbi:MAG: type I phosphomannose isomerase catalytic subunit [Planctomycetota bacterium]
MATSKPFAIQCAPLPVPRPWGGRRIAQRFGWSPPSSRGTSSRAQPADSRAESIGEWWLASCHQGAVTRLSNPPTGGPADLARWLDGPGRLSNLPSSADFPLLVKFLDCEQILSLQVHPDDTVARRHGLTRGKTEAWFVLHAEPGAAVYLGAASGRTCPDLFEAVAAGASDAQLLAMLQRIEVRAGDALLINAGTIHAIGPGLALFEVQQSSDTTYRIHDWGRGRPVQLRHAAEAARDVVALPARSPHRLGTWDLLVECEAFRLSHAAGLRDTLTWTPGPANWALLTVVCGSGELQTGGVHHQLEPGSTWLLVGEATLSGAALELLAVESDS